MIERTQYVLAVALAASMTSVTIGDGACTPTWSAALGTPGPSGGIGSVLSLGTYDDGGGESLYMGGNFNTAGAPGTNGLARWTGSEWTSVGGGINGSFVQVFGAFQGKMIIGGFFDSVGGVADTASLAAWDGTQWSSLSAQLGTGTNSVWGLHVFDDGDGEALYVGGNFFDIGGTSADYLAKWDGETWQSIDSSIFGLFPIIFDFETFDDGKGVSLYAGGRFTTIGTLDTNHIARWTGSSWVSLGSGISEGSFGTGVHAMEVFDDGTGSQLYVGGQSFTSAGGVPASNIARWDGVDWSPVGDGFNGPVDALLVYDDGAGPALYAIGRFTMSGPVPVEHIARWNGLDWKSVQGGVNDGAFGGTVFNDAGTSKLCVGGSFSTAGGLTANRVAQFIGCAASACTGDLDDDGFVGFSDLLVLIGAWGPCTPPCAADLDGDGSIGFSDVLLLIGAWGACP